MTSTVKETNYSATVRHILDRTDEASWLKILRENAIERFAEIGFPTPADEDWKYTNVAPLAGENFDLAIDAADVDREKFARLAASEMSASRLVFVNGKLNTDLSDVAALEISGAAVLNLTDAAKDTRFAEIVKQNLARIVDYNTNGFTALNTAVQTDGAFVFVPKNIKIETPVQLLFIADGESIAAFPRILIVLERGAEATIVESYLRTSETKYFTNSIVEITLADDARLTHTRVQRESHAAFHVTTTGANLERGSFYDSTNITLGGKLSRHDINVKFNAEGGEAFVDGLYLVGETQHADTHSVIDHAVPNCASHQTYKGIVDGRARAVFNGKVFVRENASGTDAKQSNKNLLLSNDARVDTKPQLEIFNDDVKCAHGATVGQLEEEELFYLLSRGLREDLARNLLTYGFAEEVINKVKIESIKKQLDEAVLNRLNANLEM